MTVLKSFLFIVILLGVGLLGCLAASGRALHPITPAQAALGRERRHGDGGQGQAPLGNTSIRPDLAPLVSGLRLRDPIDWSPAPPRPGWTLIREIEAAEYHDLTVAKEASAEAWWVAHHPHKPMPGRFATGIQDSWVLNRDLGPANADWSPIRPC